MPENSPLEQIPSVDRILTSPVLAEILAHFGKTRTTRSVRRILEQQRTGLRRDPACKVPELATIARMVQHDLESGAKASLQPVLNLTGTLLHTNLGRASLPRSAIDAVAAVASGASNLEFDLQTGSRGDRDDHVEALLIELTGAEAATLVNNNAAAVILCLNALALGRQVCVSRGELVEIGGSFRLPDIMARAGCSLVEVGTTNRTHLQDYEQAITDQTALLMKVHTSNYEIKGFTSNVSYAELAQLAHRHQLPCLADLGSGTLMNLPGLPHEPTVREILAAGADLVTFSGDKLLGGPQAGIIAGDRTLIETIKKNPLRRALRVDKMTTAALSEVLKLYQDPDTLTTRLPTLRHLTRPIAAIDQIAEQLLDAFRHAVEGVALVSKRDAVSQIGSGALPLHTLPSVAIELAPLLPGETEIQRISLAFRQLAIPIIGRLQDGKLLFDLRTVDDAGILQQQLSQLHLQ